MSGAWISLIELAAVFGLVMAFGFWQLRDLNKMDEEDAKQRESDAKDGSSRS